MAAAMAVAAGVGLFGTVNAASSGNVGECSAKANFGCSSWEGGDRLKCNDPNKGIMDWVARPVRSDNYVVEVDGEDCKFALSHTAHKRKAKSTNSLHLSQTSLASTLMFGSRSWITTASTVGYFCTLLTRPIRVLARGRCPAARTSSSTPPNLSAPMRFCTIPQTSNPLRLFTGGRRRTNKSALSRSGH